MMYALCRFGEFGTVWYSLVCPVLPGSNFGGKVWLSTATIANEGHWTYWSRKCLYDLKHCTNQMNPLQEILNANRYQQLNFRLCCWVVCSQTLLAECWLIVIKLQQGHRPECWHPHMKQTDCLQLQPKGNVLKIKTRSRAPEFACSRSECHSIMFRSIESALASESILFKSNRDSWSWQIYHISKHCLLSDAPKCWSYLPHKYLILGYIIWHRFVRFIGTFLSCQLSWAQSASYFEQWLQPTSLHCGKFARKCGYEACQCAHR